MAAAGRKRERGGMRYAVIVYTNTTSEAAMADYTRHRRWDRQREHRRRQRRKYFLRQRLMGLFLLAVTVPAVVLTGGDATIAVITVPLGLYLVFTREMILGETGRRTGNGDI